MKYRASLACLLVFTALSISADETPSPAVGPTREAALEENPFSGLYEYIDQPVLTDQMHDRNYTKFLFDNFRKENPKADPRKAELLAKLRGGTLNGLFPASEPVVMTPEAEPLDEIFRLINLLQKKKLSSREVIGQLRPLKLKYPNPCVTRADLARLIHALSEGESRKNNWDIACREWVRVLKEHPLPKEDYVFIYNIVGNGHPNNNEEKKGTWTELDEYFQTHPLDPWMRSMIAGRAGIVRAWNARGTGWGNTVTEEGWQGFRCELKKARGAFLNAAKLEPDRPHPYLQLITVEMGDGCIGDRIEMFRRAIRLMPDYMKAYSTIAWALQPRWGGSHELLFQLAETAIDTGRYDLNVPSAGVDVIGGIVDDSAWRWQNWYRRPGIPEKVDACYAYLLEHRGDTWTSFILMHKMTFEMATLRYDRALETRKKIPLDDKAFHEYWAYHSWRGNNSPGVVPRIPTYSDPVPLLNLFTGEYGAQLQAIEREYLDEDPNAACIKLAEFIRTAKLKKEGKTLLIDLYGRWQLQVGGEQYYDCQDDRKLYSPFQAAARAGAGNVMAAMIGLGYDYSAFENYPGETAILAARGDAAPELLDILKKAGDPLDRPEPEYGRSPFQTACFHNKPEIVEKLIALGCPVNAPDKENHTALQFAATKGAPEVIEILLKAGADPDAGDNDGDTALMFALQTKQGRATWEPLALAIKKVNHRNNSGRTVLHYAAEYKGSPELVKLLLQRGADSKLKDNSGNTPADVARAKGNPTLAKLLTP